MVKRILSTAAALSVALLGFSAPAGASLIGSSMDISVIAVSTFGPDTVAVADPGVEIVKGDGTSIGGTYFTQTADLGAGAFDIFEDASIDVQARDIFININLADQFSLFGGINIISGVLFEFDSVLFSGGRGIHSVGLGSNDPYFATAVAGCTISDCIDFDSNSIRFELTSPTLTEFTYRINVQPVPEPGTLLLLAGGIAGLALLRRRKAA